MQTQLIWASLGGAMVKNLLAKQETWVPSLGQEDPLEEAMATHSSILAWRIPWTEEPGRLQSMVLQSQTQLSTHTGATQLHFFFFSGGNCSTCGCRFTECMRSSEFRTFLYYSYIRTPKWVLISVRPLTALGKLYQPLCLRLLIYIVKISISHLRPLNRIKCTQHIVSTYKK